jgi:hypothetical protein
VFESRRPRTLRPSICAGHQGNKNSRLSASVSCLDVLQLKAGLASRNPYPNPHESDTQKLACRCNLDSGPNDGLQTLGMLNVVLGYGRWILSDDHDETNASACLSRDEPRSVNDYSQASIDPVEIGHDDESCSTIFSNVTRRQCDKIAAYHVDTSQGVLRVTILLTSSPKQQTQ